MNIEQIIQYIYIKDYEALKKAISRGVNLNDVDKDGRTPLMHAVLAENADAQIVQFLIQNGADPNIQEKEQQWTALHFAADNQKLEISAVLLKLGAKVDAQDNFGHTPLWKAVLHSKTNADLIKLLLEKGADSHKSNKSGISPQKLAEKMGNTELGSTLK